VPTDRPTTSESEEAADVVGNEVVDCSAVVGDEELEQEATRSSVTGISRCGVRADDNTTTPFGIPPHPTEKLVAFLHHHTLESDPFTGKQRPYFRSRKQSSDVCEVGDMPDVEAVVVLVLG
jgi:hypothetical protein